MPIVSRYRFALGVLINVCVFRARMQDTTALFFSGLLKLS